MKVNGQELICCQEVTNGQVFFLGKVKGQRPKMAVKILDPGRVYGSDTPLKKRRGATTAVTPFLPPCIGMGSGVAGPQLKPRSTIFIKIAQITYILGINL